LRAADVSCAGTSTLARQSAAEDFGNLTVCVVVPDLSREESQAAHLPLRPFRSTTSLVAFAGIAMDAERASELTATETSTHSVFATFGEALACGARKAEKMLGFACKKPSGNNNARAKAGRGEIFFKRI
jgi:hypothetical protein